MDNLGDQMFESLHGLLFHVCAELLPARAPCWQLIFTEQYKNIGAHNVEETA